jgi:small conductance mechanosensitive channel
MDLRSAATWAANLPSVLGARGWFALQLVLLILGVYVARRLSWALARRVVRISRYASRAREHRPARQMTLQGLLADGISGAVLVAAFLLALVRLAGVPAQTMAWAIGLLGAGIGLAARPLISDYLAGIGFVIEDTFSVGEKVRLGTEEGVIERVDLRTTQLRAMSGELVTVPNGEIRIVHNFSRGRFSTADVHLNLAAVDVARALPLLTALGEEAARDLPDLDGPWQIISKSGELGSRTSLTLLARTTFGKGADLRPQLMALVHERLRAAGIAFDGGNGG